MASAKPEHSSYFVSAQQKTQITKAFHNLFKTSVIKKHVAELHPLDEGSLRWPLSAMLEERRGEWVLASVRNSLVCIKGGQYNAAIKLSDYKAGVT